jgi:enoyl-CoA hydratase
MSERSGHLHVTDEGSVRTIEIDRPEAKNALNGAMRTELCELLAAADRDPEVSAVVLAAVDPVFSAGVDFKDVTPSYDPVAARYAVNPGRALRAMRTPVICAVNGACVSGALEIALSSSFVVASERARFADTHARLGVVATWGLTALLPRAVGVRKAREMSITGNFVDAAAALSIGLVNHVVPHEELRPFTARLAADIAATPAVGEVLSLYTSGEDLSLAAALELEAEVTSVRAVDLAAFRVAGEAAARRQHGTGG